MLHQCVSEITFSIRGVEMSLPESFTTIKAKMSGNVRLAIEGMNDALAEICSDPEIKAKDKLKATQDYLAMYMRIENEIMREAEHREVMKQRKLNTKIKQAEVADLDDDGMGFKPVVQSNFSPNMPMS